MDKDFQKRQMTDNDFWLYFSVILAQARIHTPCVGNLKREIVASFVTKTERFVDMDPRLRGDDRLYCFKSMRYNGDYP